MRLLILAASIIFTNLAFATCDEQVSQVIVSRPPIMGYFGVRHGSIDGVTLTDGSGNPYDFSASNLTIVADRRNGPEGVVAIRSDGTEGYSGPRLGLFNKAGRFVLGVRAPRHLKFGQTEFKWDDVGGNIYRSYSAVHFFDPQTHELRSVSLRATDYEHLIFPVVRLKQGFLVVTWQSENSSTLKVSLFSETGDPIALLMIYEYDENEFSKLAPEQFFDIAPDGTITFLAGRRSGNRVHLNVVTPDGKLTSSLIPAPNSKLKVLSYY